MTLDRTQQPPVLPIEEVNIVQPVLMSTANGIDIYVLDMGEQEVLRLDLMFHCGKWTQSKLFAAMLTNAMLREGVAGMNSQEIAEELDFYGAWLQTSAATHTSYVTLYSLNKHLEHTLPLLERIIKQPTFPESEFEVIRAQRKRSMLVELEKGSVLANNRFQEVIMGEESPYGRIAQPHDLDLLTREDLVDYHKQCYSSSRCTIMLTGRVTAQILEAVQQAFCDSAWGEQDTIVEEVIAQAPLAAGTYSIEKADAQQTSIRIGFPSINLRHPDFADFRILNTLFGGYFGSRLMMNIREEKGYTYSISSAVTNLRYASYLSITTETAHEYRDLVLEEVKAEMIRLQDELVSEPELEMLKGYLMGDLARLFDGPFSIADAHISLMANRLTADYFYNMMQAIRDITPERLRELARTYLHVEQLRIILVGQGVA